MKFRTSILLYVAIAVSVFILLNLYHTYLRGSFSEDPVMDSLLASLPELGVLVGASIVINEVLKRGKKIKKIFNKEI